MSTVYCEFAPSSNISQCPTDSCFYFWREVQVPQQNGQQTELVKEMCINIPITDVSVLSAL